MNAPRFAVASEQIWSDNHAAPAVALVVPAPFWQYHSGAIAWMYEV
jgi:hypothetical protein